MTTITDPAGSWPTLPGGDLALTTARWRNRRRRVQGGYESKGQNYDKWRKVLAHQGGYEQFSYGTDTEAGTQPSRNDGPTQRAIIGSPQSGVIHVDVDDEDAYLTSRTGALIGRPHALTTRGRGFHILIDARLVPPEDWPVQGPIAGADIKSKGFIPWPGSEHYSGERYELTEFGRGPAVVPAWPELMAAILADRGAHHRSGGPGGNGGGHDGELAAEVLRMILRGWDKETCYQMWCTIATPHDLAWPYERADFERHHRGAARKAQEITEQNAQVMATWRAHMDRYAGGVR